MFSKKIKILVTIILVMVVVVAVRRNVTITKEPDGVTVDNRSMQLEVNSEAVKVVFNKLTLLNVGLFDDEVYDNMYFNMEEDTKELSSDEKLFLVFETLYGEHAYLKEEVPKEKAEILKVDLGIVKDRYESIFMEEFKPEEIDYRVARKRGIVSMSLQDQEYVLKFKRQDSTRIKKAKIEKAEKAGDFINLKVKAFYATKISSYEGSELIYKIKNYGENKIIAKVPKNKLDDDEVFKNDSIYSYVFSFELRGEEYYLNSIKRDA